MRKHIAISCLSALLGFSQTATADVGDSERVDSTHRKSAATTDAYYPRAWCIKTYLSTSARSAAVSRLAPPSLDRSVTHSRDSIVADEPIATTAYTNKSSLLERLRALKARPLATLWRGRDTALVLRIQDGGYFGFSIDDNRIDAD